jgi:hypothetical protein
MNRPLSIGAALAGMFFLQPAQAELIALYRFDEATGSTANESVEANHATWIPGVEATPNWQPAGGRIGGAIRFPGAGNHQNYFAIPSFPALNGMPKGMTISTWFKPEGNSGYRGILMSRNVGGQLFGFGHDGHHLDGRVAGTPIDSPDNSLTATGEWFHLAWVWDNLARTQRLYLNGVPTGPAQSVSAQTIPANSDWRIADDACCNDRNLRGLLDDLAVWNEPLAAAQIAAIHANGLNGIGIGETAPPPVTAPLNVGLVINEVHCEADPKTEFIEFVELLNTGPVPLDLGGYRFTDGIDFVFPPGTLLGVAEYLLLGENTAALASRFPNLPQTFQYSGSLSNDGESLTLRDATGTLVDTVTYRAEFPWPILADGASMQLVNATLDNDLGASWRPALPTPGFQNSPFAPNAPPQLRQVAHFPAQPTAVEATTISIKATDPDGIASLTLHYQIVAPGNYIPAFLPLPTATLKSSPATPLSPNPAFESNWIDVPMTASGDFYSGVIPAQPHRTLVRYRITATDTLGHTVRAPFPEDPSLNFAYFSYNGVPDYVASQNSVHPDGPGHIYPAEILTTLPVYHLLTRPADLAQCWAYNAADQVGGVAARKVFNWEGAMVYDGEVYDHVEYRLRQRNDRYAGQGRRSMRFRFQPGREFQARDPAGKKYPVKWRSMNTSKMSRFAEGANHGLRELVSSRLWNLAGVVAPEFQHVHFRVIDDSAEAPDQYHGDFFGLAMIFEDVDARFLESRGLPRGNVYKLKDGESNPLELQQYQARDAVADGSDFINIRDNLGPPTQSDQWLRDHVDWNSWYLYAALGEGFRHYDFSPFFQKNRIWYFKPAPGTPFGLLSIIPHDTDATWKRGTNDTQWNDPRYGPGPGTQRGRVVGIDLPKEAIQEITGLDGTDGENHPERPAFMLEYRNVLREVRDLFWQPETVHTVIDDAYERIAAFSLADRDRWSGGPADAGSENIGPLETQVALMKNLAFTEDLYLGNSLADGRAQWLTNLADDPAIPDQPTITRSGTTLNSSAFADPEGAGTFSKMQWRIAEILHPQGPESVPLVVSGDSWKYLDSGADPGATWTEPNYSEASWSAGPTQIGYGETDEATTVAGGHATTYFRRKITLADAAAFAGFDAAIVRDDGVIVYVNGIEVYRNQMPPGPVDFTTLASASATGSNETDFQLFSIPAARFVAGENTLAVEMHQNPALSGDMSFDFRLDGIPPRPEHHFEWNASWISEGTSDSITPPGLATRGGKFYRARVRHQDTTGRWSHWSEPVEFVASQPDLSPYRNALVISEIMYHPTNPTAAEIAAGFTNNDDFEYLEIRNVGTQTIALSDVRFTKGIDFDFPAGTLARGAFTLVVKNPAAFEMRYGPGHPVAGVWSGKLDNGGEQLKLSFGAGEAIRDFVYDDVSPWPTSPDGAGRSLVLVDPFGLPDHGDPFSWREGAATPGATDGTTFGGGDFLSYAAGPSSITLLPDGHFAFAIELNRLAEDVIGSPEISPNLIDWNPTSVSRTSVVPIPEGRARVIFTDRIPFGEDRWFLRYSFRQR